MFIYNNFDLDFKVAQPTAGKSGWRVSMTSATFSPYANTYNEDLQFTKELHKTSPFNKDLEPGDPQIYKPSIHDILPSRTGPIRTLDPL